MPKPSRNPPITGLSIDDVMRSTGLSRQTVYNEINSGRLASFKVGRRRLIRPSALDSWAKKLEDTAA
jgi:excisionase family DNA binding protein